MKWLIFYELFYEGISDLRIYALTMVRGLMIVVIPEALSTCLD